MVPEKYLKRPSEDSVKPTPNLNDWIKEQDPVRALFKKKADCFSKTSRQMGETESKLTMSEEVFVEIVGRLFKK